MRRENGGRPMKETVLERMERIDAKRKMQDFTAKMHLPYEFKVKYARIRAQEFVRECELRDLNYHVSVGGLDSITLLCFLRSIGIDAPGISASYLEDPSIQRVQRQLGVESVKPLKCEDGSYYNPQKLVQKFGFPVLSKELAAKIELLQNPTAKNATVRHAIVTGETGEYGGNRKDSRMKMPQIWLDKFGGYANEEEGTNYGKPDFCVSSKCCYYLKERPCDLWAKEHNSVPFLGLMASEGGRRAKSLKINGCNYFGESTIRSAPFAIFLREDLLQLALDLNVPVPEIYGEIKRGEDGKLCTTKAQRTGCAICGFGIHMEKRPHRFDLLYERDPKKWEKLMYRLCKTQDGEDYGWGHVLDYIGVDWKDPELWLAAKDGNLPGQMNLFEGGDDT